MRGRAGLGALVVTALLAGCTRSRPTYEYEPTVTTVRVGAGPATPVGPGDAAAGASPGAAAPPGTSTPSGVPTTTLRPSVWKTRDSK